MGVGSADYKLGVRDTMRIAENLREPNPGLRWRSAGKMRCIGYNEAIDDQLRACDELLKLNPPPKRTYRKKEEREEQIRT